ncbi:hypothetical protein GGF50DRAFT_52006 [Schizophyllum commune]
MGAISLPDSDTYLDKGDNLTSLGGEDVRTPLLPGGGLPSRSLEDQRRRRIRICRFCHFALLSTLLIFAVHLLSDTVRYQTSRILGLNMDDHDFPIPPGVTLEECPAWDIGENSHVGKVSFKFDLPDEELFALARGPRSHGKIHIRQSDVVTDDVLVNVEVHTDTPAGFDHAKACLAKREGNDDTAGLGIFTDEWWNNHHHRHHHYIHFAVELVLPKLKDDVLQVNKLTTDLPIFQHTIEELADTVLFQTLSLQTFNAGIYAKSIHAVHGTVGTSNAGIDGVFQADEALTLRTSNGHVAATASAPIVDVITANGAIEGEYNASKDLALFTQNAHIYATVALENDPAGPETKARVHTANGQIRLATSLTSTQSTSGAFALDTRTHNTGLTLEFLSSPLDAALTLDAHTTLGKADVRLHPTYEGAFDASTSLARVQVRKGEEDEGTGRGARGLELRQNVGTHVEGAVGWSEEGKVRGSARVSSSIGAVELWV